MKIAIDAMGSDNYPVPDIAGAVLAAREWKCEIVLVGDEAVIGAELAKHDTSGLDISIKHAAEHITMDDKPAQAVRGKRNSSTHIGLGLLKSGEADGFVSAGNTGGTVSVAALHSPRRIRGIKRFAIGARFPTPGYPLLIDTGANVDCTAENLAQFGLMGSLFMELGMQINKPRVGLLTIGEEDGKGNAITKAAAELLRELPINFIGNIEPKVFMSGNVEVAVADGFVGNIFLKTAEATARSLQKTIYKQIMSSTRTKIGGWLAQPAFDKAAEIFSADKVGGAPLLGVNGVVIIAHGGSSPYAIKNAIGQARMMILGKVVDAIKSGLKKGEQ
ncbi:MAG: phosphate acyltransferase PlsX [Candidatus Promineifilaceae bacterium]